VQCGNGFTAVEIVLVLAESIAYLMHHHKLSSEQYSHADCKMDLEQGCCSVLWRMVLSVRRLGCALSAVVMVWLQEPHTQGSRACLPNSRVTPSHMSKVSTANAWCVGTGQSGFVVVAGPFVGRRGTKLVILGICTVLSWGIWRKGLCCGRVARRHGSEHATCLA
jgi:hypothetical protein